ncbi:MAG: DNA internalization-related competence protein ComEC/Rec2 [Clostridia bacterium]|nr:DNA internalization-related competence protein ComEC/Rec2 [Clostridia bacterium]
MLFFVLALMLLLGNVRAGWELNMRDAPTQPGVQIEGVISRIEKPYRVYLRDVKVDGVLQSYAREVVVTLMLEEEAVQPNEPRVGQRVAGKGRLFAPDEARNPGGVDWRISSICKGYELSGYLLPGWTAEGEAVFSFRECMRRLRSAIRLRLDELFGEQAPLFQGIMLGDRSELDEEVAAAMRLTGTAHILTVSGLHLSLIAGAISRLLGCFAMRRKTRFAILSVFLLSFTALTGAAAGTVRACIMAMLRETAKLRGRRYEPLTALSFAALCMTLVQPLWLMNASFQFSFFVVLGIQLFANGFSAIAARLLKLKGLLLRALNLFAVSLSAQLGSVPMQLMLYGYVPLLSLPMNVLCSMIMPFLLLGGWMAVAVSVLSVDAGVFLAKRLSAAAAGFEAAGVSVAALDGSVIRLPAPYGATVLLTLVLFLLLSTRIRFGSRRTLTALIVLCAVAASYAVRFNPQARYVQLDVGQGDGALFRRGRRAVLVDVGPADSYEALRYLRHEGLFVDALILSHLDEDHAGALGVLLDSEVEIPAVIMARGAVDRDVSPQVSEALARLGGEGVALHEVQRGDRIEANGISFDVLSPDDTLVGSNERSLLLHARTEGVSFLLAGDLPSESEPASVPDVDVLKVAHHGSKNSTSESFVRMASPEIALISVGENNWYGHPHARVLDALEEAQVLRTDRHGCITIYLNQGIYEARSFFKPRP